VAHSFLQNKVRKKFFFVTRQKKVAVVLAPNLYLRALWVYKSFGYVIVKCWFIAKRRNSNLYSSYLL